MWLSAERLLQSSISLSLGCQNCNRDFSLVLPHFCRPLSQTKPLDALLLWMESSDIILSVHMFRRSECLMVMWTEAESLWCQSASRRWRLTRLSEASTQLWRVKLTLPMDWWISYLTGRCSQINRFPPFRYFSWGVQFQSVFLIP